MEILGYIAVGVGAYLIGSISPALIISNVVARKDIRNYGSGNAGTTNMVRTFGWQLGLATFLLDILKGIICVVGGRYFMGDMGMLLASILVVIGHNWPVYYGFRGGKGIATTMGVLFIVTPDITGCVFVVAMIIIFTTKYVSLASILCTALIAICSFIFSKGIYVNIITVVLAALALYGHRANIKRLLNGTENKLSFKKKSADKEDGNEK